VTYDAISYSGILSANLADFGASVVPTYKFENAEVIVSFGADFLGTWISPVEFTKGWSKGRIPSKDKNMSLHIQFESNMSLTGTNAAEGKALLEGSSLIPATSFAEAVRKTIALGKGESA
jgi:molybdopterin-containing oxidoreductase family iron-sulfur binding subunit